MLQTMLQRINREQIRFIGILAKAARMQRDQLLGNVAEDDLSEFKKSRGDHNPTADFGFEPLPPEAPQMAALREALSTLSPEARCELFALMRIGQGHLAAGKWHRGLVEAEALGDRTITAALMEDADLHDHLAKAMYETNLSP